MTGYVRKFDDNTTMPFKISNKQLLKKYNQIWKKVKSLLNIKFDSGPVYGGNDKYLKTKIKTYGGSLFTKFQDKKMTKEKAPCKTLSIIIPDSEKEVSSNIFGRMQIWSKKDKNGEPLLMMI